MFTLFLTPRGSLRSLGGWAPGSGGGMWPKPFLPALGAELCPDSAQMLLPSQSRGRDCHSIRPLNGMLIYLICREEGSSCRGLTSEGTCSPCPLSSSSLSQTHTHIRSI